MIFFILKTKVRPITMKSYESCFFMYHESCIFNEIESKFLIEFWLLYHIFRLLFSQADNA